MRLVRFGERGAEKPGLVDDRDTIRDLSSHINDIDGEALGPATLKRLAAIDPYTLPAVPNGTRLGSPVARTRQFIAVGLNYADHAAEAKMPIPTEPVLFMKAVTCIQGPDDEVRRPIGSTKLDYEAELAMAIGSSASYVSEDEALAHVAGYLICDDVSERSYQLERGGTWDKGKGCPTFGPLGPWLATPDEVGDVQNLDIWLSLNGERRQAGNTRTMIFSCAKLISYISAFIELVPGDIITTGTPPGVGMGQVPPRYLENGDLVEVGIEKLGRQRHRVGG